VSPPLSEAQRLEAEVQRLQKYAEHMNGLVAAYKEVAARDAAEVQRLREALTKIAAIEDKMFGSDWEEIEEARQIARAAIKGEKE
jgi:hypothetical protein